MTEQETGSTHTLSQAPTVLSCRRTGPEIALIAYHSEGTEVVVLEPEIPLVIGRAPASGFGISNRTLSREHARFTLSDGRVRVEDLGSKNGMYVGMRRIDRVELDVGDEVILGGVRVRAQALGARGESLGIEGEEALRRYGEEEISRALEFRRPFGFLFVRAVDARTSAPASSGARPFLDVVRQRIRPVDRIGLYGRDALHIILPETGLDGAMRIARALSAPLPLPDVVFVVGVVVHAGELVSMDDVIERSQRAARKASPQSPVEVFPTGTWVFGSDEQDDRGDVIAGARMQQVLDVVSRVASSRLPVILLGETGTGKEVLARLIHEQGPRKSRRMVRVNCGAIPKDLAESTLFGHERGAFTGAVQQQKGVFEEADGGTVFLDEIGELPFSVQATLLRVLETHSFCRVGSTREISVDIRIVAATHRDLDSMVEAGSFRADLYYRLGGVTIDIPSLAERIEDIEPLARRFLRLANENNGRNVQGISPEAMEILRSYGWPGNVREFRNTIERAVVVARGAMIGPEDLPARLRGGRTSRHPASTFPELTSDLDRGSDPDIGSSRSSVEQQGAEQAAPARGKVQQYETTIVRDALKAAGWNRVEAAKMLDMPVRTLSYRMKVLGIKKPEA